LKKKFHNARRQAKDQSAEEQACSQDDTPPAAAPASAPQQTPESRYSTETPAESAEDPEAENGPAAVAAQADTAPGGQSDESSDSVEEDEFDGGIIEHVQLLASLIDGEELSRQETIALLKRVMRQRSIAKGSALDYALGQLKQKPP
jgi:hypothetical protein